MVVVRAERGVAGEVRQADAVLLQGPGGSVRGGRGHEGPGRAHRLPGTKCHRHPQGLRRRSGPEDLLQDGQGRLPIAHVRHGQELHRGADHAVHPLLHGWLGDQSSGRGPDEGQGRRHGPAQEDPPPLRGGRMHWRRARRQPSRWQQLVGVCGLRPLGRRPRRHDQPAFADGPRPRRLGSCDVARGPRHGHEVWPQHGSVPLQLARGIAADGPGGRPLCGHPRRVGRRHPHGLLQPCLAARGRRRRRHLVQDRREGRADRQLLAGHEARSFVFAARHGWREVGQAARQLMVVQGPRDPPHQPPVRRDGLGPRGTDRQGLHQFLQWPGHPKEKRELRHQDPVRRRGRRGSGLRHCIRQLERALPGADIVLPCPQLPAEGLDAGHRLRGP
mmetsp:Transcript_114916/g.329989  ORF Transcript_114916/g.329989 Transcript_114916/m.329989 type:complete len:388 (+) Transcript_114916:1349-2512(+)